MGGATSKRQEKYLCLQLHNAIIGGDEAVARELLLCGAVSPNNKLFAHSRKLFLPLFTAVENNCLPLVEILLQYDASTSAINKEGNTALHIAADQNLLQVAEVLLRHKADPCTTNAQGKTPLHIAAIHGLVNMASLLISSGANVNLPGPHERTPLHSACAITGNNDMITTLLNNGADLDALDENKHVSLHYLAQLGNTQGIDILLQAGANKNACDSKGKSALHFAVENQEVQATRALLRHGCDVNIQDSKGQTPLYKAVDKEYSDLVLMLLENAADCNLATNSGFFPLRIAIWKKNFDIAQKLLSHGDANVNACDRNGITALHVACLYSIRNSDDDMELVELLIGNGADVNARCTKHGRSPLHNAVDAGNDETVMILLRNGADPSIADNKGKTPRSLATSPSITALFDSVVYSAHGSTFTANTERTPSLTRDLNTSLALSNSTTRPANFYTPPTARSSHIPSDSASVPPPLPPRDVPFQQINPTALESVAPVPVLTLPPTNVIRHHFVWSSLDSDAKMSSETSAKRLKVDVTSSSKLTSFPTSFGGDKGDPSMFCYSIARAGQLVNTKLGCLLNIEPGSVTSTVLLYVQAMNYSADLLPLPTSHRLCSNIVHFYTHCLTSGRGSDLHAPRGVLPEKEVPQFSKPALIEFPLRKSALSLYDKNENEFKMLVSYNEGLHWEEQACRVEKIRMEEEEDDHAHMAVAEVEELGMFAVVLCPKLDVKTDVKHGDKVVSSIDPGVSLALNIDHDDSCDVDIRAERIQPTELEKLHNQGFAYVLSCSRVVSMQVKRNKVVADVCETPISVSVNLPISISHSSSHSDVSYRILKKSEKPLQSGWQYFERGTWDDVTDKECQHLQVSTKGKRLLGSHSSSPPHVSFDVLLDASLKYTFLVTAVRSFTRSLSKHLIEVPLQIEKIKTTTNLCFLIHNKATRLSDVTCDIVLAKDAKNVDQVYLDSGSYHGPPPSSAQPVCERNFIDIATSGGLKLKNNCEIKTRKICVHSALLPYSERFQIKGTAHGQNTTSDYIGSFNFTLAGNNDQNCGQSCVTAPRSALNSESSVLVVENRAFSDVPPSPTLVQTENNLLASLTLKIPRKHHLKINKSTLSNSTNSGELTKQVMEQVCRRLDRMEMKELAFQLAIPDQKINDAFSASRDDLEIVGFSMLEQWSKEITSQNRSAVAALCSALSCIGRESLSQDVARKCDPFVLEELSGLAPLPETVLAGNCESDAAETSNSFLR